MDKNAITIIILVGLVVAGTAVGMVYVETKQAPATPVHPERSERQIERNQFQASMIEQQVLRDKASIAAISNRPKDNPGCFDSDASRGANAIYVRGSVQVGGGESFDHCRLDQLVEFSCVERPVGSGQFFSDATIADCPSGWNCVEGACVR